MLLKIKCVIFDSRIFVKHKFWKPIKSKYFLFKVTSATVHDILTLKA